MVLNTLTFELRIFLRKRRYRLEQHKKGVRRKLYFIVPSQEAKSGQPLAPILGQVQINTFDFCTLFNERTSIFLKGAPIYVELVVNWDKTWILNFKPFPLSEIIRLFCFGSFNYYALKFHYNDLIYLVNLYKLIIIMRSVFSYLDAFSATGILLGNLSSSKTGISLYSDTDMVDYFQYFLTKYLSEYLIIQQCLLSYESYNQYIVSVLTILEKDFVNLDDSFID